MKPVLALLTLLALASGALAQPSPPAATPAAPTPAPVDPAKLALARETIAAMHADRMFEGMAGQIKQLATQLAPPTANLTPAQRQKNEEFQAKVMDLALNASRGLIARMDQIYAEVFSEAELKGMRAFFLSPEGQSMLAKQPQIMTRLMPLVQEMQRDLMPKLQQLVEETKAAEAAPASADEPAVPAEPGK